MVNQRQLRIGGLQNHLPLPTSPARPTAHLLHHHVGIFESPEIRQIEHGITLQDADHRDMGKVQTLAHHLGAYQNIRMA